jgi:SH3-like domain-containing protein
MNFGRRVTPLLLASLLLFSACDRGRSRVLEIAYVSAPQAFLRDHVAAVYAKTGTVKNGDRVDILERDRRFARVRTASGAEGWIEQRYLVIQQVFDGFQKLAQQTRNNPGQAIGVTRNDTNLHLDPGRDTEHLYLLNQGAKVSLLQRATAEKNSTGIPPTPASKSQSPAQPPVPLEDWWLIRNSDGRVGWVLGRMLDVDVPLDIAQYAEGQRIVAALVLDEVQDADKKVSQYLVMLTEPKDGMPFDYNQIRVFTWNVKRHRYETAYRERNLNGVLPVTVSRESFDKEGTLPVFVLHVKDDSGNVIERKYKLNTPIVRRVLAPGEEPPKPAPRRRRR